MEFAEMDRDTREEIDQRVLYYATMGRDRLDQRIEQLDQEWDLDRWLLAAMSGLSVLALLLGGRKKGRWALFSGLAGGYLLTQPYEESPLYMFLRGMGIRTKAEIEREKLALRAIRGDMDVMREELLEALHHALGELEQIEGNEAVSH